MLLLSTAAAHGGRTALTDCLKTFCKMCQTMSGKLLSSVNLNYDVVLFTGESTCNVLISIKLVDFWFRDSYEWIHCDLIISFTHHVIIQ